MTLPVDRPRWLTVLASLARQAPTRQAAFYERLRRLRPVMSADGWVSAPEERLRRAMGAEVSRRTVVRTLAFAVEQGLLSREIAGGWQHQAVYRATLPPDVAAPRSESVMRLDPRTGERLPDGRRPRQALPEPAAEPGGTPVSVSHEPAAEGPGAAAEGRPDSALVSVLCEPRNGFSVSPRWLTPSKRRGERNPRAVPGTAGAARHPLRRTRPPGHPTRPDHGQSTGPRSRRGPARSRGTPCRGRHPPDHPSSVVRPTRPRSHRDPTDRRGTMIRVLGIDPSLTGSAVATANGAQRIPTSDTWPTLRRLRVIRAGVQRAAMDADIVVIEGPAFSAKFGKPHERAGLWWLLVERIEAVTTAAIAVLPIQHLKIYATGDGGADKSKVTTAARWHFGDRIVTDDEADATWCAAAGHAAIGQPLLALPPEHTRGLTSLTWIRPYDPATARLRAAERALGGPR